MPLYLALRTTDQSGYFLFIRVTSFVLRYLHKTLTTDWSKQVYIDLEVMNKIARWLVTTQNEEGAFVETADHYYDRNMGVSL